MNKITKNPKYSININSYNSFTHKALFNCLIKQKHKIKDFITTFDIVAKSSKKKNMSITILLNASRKKQFFIQQITFLI